MNTKIIVCVIYSVISVLGLTLIKIGAAGNSVKLISFPIIGEITLHTFLGLGFYVVSFILYIFIVQNMQLSIVFPILTALNNISIVLIGYIVFHETLRTGKIVGVMMIIVGIACVSCF